MKMLLTDILRYRFGSRAFVMFMAMMLLGAPYLQAYNAIQTEIPACGGQCCCCCTGCGIGLEAPEESDIDTDGCGCRMEESKPPREIPLDVQSVDLRPTVYVPVEQPAFSNPEPPASFPRRYAATPFSISETPPIYLVVSSFLI
jgi:hypothetical protein